MLQARTGRWGYGISCSSAPGFPLLKSTSIISCRLVSHLTGSPNRITPGRFQEMLGNSQCPSTRPTTKSHPLAKEPPSGMPWLTQLPTKHSVCQGSSLHITVPCAPLLPDAGAQHREKLGLLLSACASCCVRAARLPPDCIL